MIIDSDPIALIIQFTAVGFAGLCLGSFSTAIIDRELKKQSWIKDSSGQAARSMCPSCHHTLGFFDLIPIFSWIFLRGKCRYCEKAVSFFYPAIEITCLITAWIFLILAGWNSALLILLAGLPFWLSLFFILFRKARPSGILVSAGFLSVLGVIFYVLFAFIL